MASLKLACMVMLCMAVVSAPMMAKAITCPMVTANLAPCLPYLMRGGTASERCCDGVKRLLGETTTTTDKQTVCTCIKNAARDFSVSEKYAQSLPTQCNVNVHYKISGSTNCASIRF